MQVEQERTHLSHRHFKLVCITFVLTTFGCLLDMELPTPLNPDIIENPENQMDASPTTNDASQATTDSATESQDGAMESQDSAMGSQDSAMGSQDSAMESLDSTVITDQFLRDAVVPNNTVDMMVDAGQVEDPCRSVVIDSGFQLRGFAYEVLEGTTTDNSGCMPAINTALLPTIRGSSRVRWTGDITADQAGYRLSTFLPNLDNTGCTQLVRFTGNELGGIENLNFGLPVGQTPFVFELTCSGNIPAFEVNFVP